MALFIFGLLFAIVNAYQKNHKIPAVLPREQFFTYVTRPDLLVARWNVTFYDREALDEGYWFTAPYDELVAEASTKPYIGPAIYDSNGELIWSPGARFHNADVHDFRVSQINGKPYLTWVSLYDQAAVVIDEHYREANRQFIGKADEHANMHEFNIVDNGTRALLFYHNRTRASAEMSDAVGYDGRCNVMSHTIVEMDTTNWGHWEETFEWHMLDHIAVNESTVGRDIIDRKCSYKYDFLHANAVDKCPDGNLLLSTRNADTLFKINRQDGSIMWRLGGQISDIDADFQFSRQHHVRCRGSNATHTMLTFFDNSNGVPHTNQYSRGLSVIVDDVNKKGHVVHEYPHPYGEITVARGSCETLSNGNVMMGWSIRSLMSEHTADGRMIMTAQTVPEWLISYRSYKFPWIGRPQHPPDVQSRIRTLPSRSSSTMTIVYVSWNGATEVRYWNLYKTDRSGQTRELVASVARSGFETQLVYDGYASYVVVEALDADGNPLPFGQSRVIETKIPSKIIAPPEFEDAKEKETQWLQDAESDESYSWASQAESIITTPWSMFLAGILASLGVGAGVCLGWRAMGGDKSSWLGNGERESWWDSKSYLPLADDEEDKAGFEDGSSDGSCEFCCKEAVYAPRNDRDITQ